MSIYIKEKTEYVEECFQSLLHQTVLADEWVIVEDGPLTKEMYDLLTHYEKAYINPYWSSSSSVCFCSGRSRIWHPERRVDLHLPLSAGAHRRH